MSNINTGAGLGQKKRKITVTVGPQGQVTVDTEGFVGNSCSVETAKLQQMLTTTTSQVDDKKKPEFYDKAAAVGVKDTLRM